MRTMRALCAFVLLLLLNASALAGQDRPHLSSDPRVNGARALIEDGRFDAITLAVVQNGLGQIASEMDLVHQKTSFSPVISEAFDRANGIYDRNDGKIISPSEYISPPSTSQRAR